MKASKTKRPASPKTTKDLPVDKPQDVKGGIIIDFGQPKAIIDDGTTALTTERRTSDQQPAP